MKLKSVVKSLLSDAEVGVGPKTDLVAFLQRYSVAERPLTHYACRGKTTEVIRKLLLGLGMKERTDFIVESSILDPEFNQIRFPSTGKISELIANLVAATRGKESFFEALHVAIAGKRPPDALLDMLPDSESGIVVPAAGQQNPRHLAMRILKRTKALVPVIAKICQQTPRDSSRIKNLRVALDTAEEFLAENYDLETGEPLTNDAPYILPVSVLEIYARLAGGLAGPQGTPPGDALVFKTDTKVAMDLFRLVRIDEALVWKACLNAPLSYLWNTGLPSVEGGEETNETNKASNLLKTYLFRGMDKVITANLSNKAGVAVLGNALLIHDKGGDDNVTPALCVANIADLWDYLVRIYALAYGVSAGLSCQCHIGVDRQVDCWADKDGIPPDAWHYTQKLENAWKTRVGSGGGSLIAEYAVFLGDDVSTSYSDVYSFLGGGSRFQVRFKDDSGKPDFSKYLTKEELGWEWFAMTHLDTTWTDPVALAAVRVRHYITEERVEVLKPLKAMAARADPEALAKLSSFADNTARLSPRMLDDGTPEYTPLSALWEGICVSLRQAWSGHSSYLELVPVEGYRSSRLLLTNVYSGVWTDRSPVMGSPEDDGTEFPQPWTGHTHNMSSALDDTEEDKAALTAALDRMCAGSLEQVRFSKRTEGSKRHYALIVETNIDAAKFLLSIDRALLGKRLGTVFLQTMLRGGCNPACAFDDFAMRDSAQMRVADFHSAMEGCVHRLMAAQLSSASRSGDFRLPNGVYDTTGPIAENLTVCSRMDARGRLIIIFSCSGDPSTYGRMVYRWRCGAPVATATIMESLAEREGAGDDKTVFVIAPNERGSLKKADDILRRQMCSRSTDYHGDDGRGSTSGSEGHAGPLFRMPIREVGDVPWTAPAREWFLRHSSAINCAHVFEEL